MEHVRTPSQTTTTSCGGGGCTPLRRDPQPSAAWRVSSDDAHTHANGASCTRGVQPTLVCLPDITQGAVDLLLSILDTNQVGAHGCMHTHTHAAAAITTTTPPRRMHSCVTPCPYPADSLPLTPNCYNHHANPLATVASACAPLVWFGLGWYLQPPRNATHATARGRAGGGRGRVSAPGPTQGRLQGAAEPVNGGECVHETSNSGAHE